jgi:hypothetical protein
MPSGKLDFYCERGKGIPLKISWDDGIFYTVGMPSKFRPRHLTDVK